MTMGLRIVAAETSRSIVRVAPLEKSPLSCGLPEIGK